MPKVKPSTSRKGADSDDGSTYTSTDSEAGYDSAPSSSSSTRKSLTKSRASSKKQHRSKLERKPKMKVIEPKRYFVEQWVQKLRESGKILENIIP